MYFKTDFGSEAGALRSRLACLAAVSSDHATTRSCLVAIVFATRIDLIWIAVLAVLCAIDDEAFRPQPSCEPPCNVTVVLDQQFANDEPPYQATACLGAKPEFHLKSEKP